MGFELGQRIKRGRVQARGAQEVEQALAPPVALGQQQHPLRRGTNVRLQARQRVLGAAHHGQFGQLLGKGAVFHIGRAFAQRELGAVACTLVELLGAEEQRIGRQRGALRVAGQHAVALARVLPEALEGAFQLAVQHQRGLFAEVVEHRGGFVEEQRQVVLDARRRHAVAHVLVDAALGRVAFEQLAPAVAKARARRIVHGELAPGQQPHLGHGVEAALAVGVEGADGVDLVIKQVHAVGLQRTHGKQVDQPTAHRVFARADHLAHMLVARQRELGAQPGLVQLLLGLEVEGVARQKRRRSQAVQRRGGGHQHHVGLALGDAPER